MAIALSGVLFPELTLDSSAAYFSILLFLFAVIGPSSSGCLELAGSSAGESKITLDYELALVDSTVIIHFSVEVNSAVFRLR